MTTVCLCPKNWLAKHKPQTKGQSCSKQKNCDMSDVTVTTIVTICMHADQHMLPQSAPAGPARCLHVVAGLVERLHAPLWHHIWPLDETWPPRIPTLPIVLLGKCDWLNVKNVMNVNVIVHCWGFQHWLIQVCCVQQLCRCKVLLSQSCNLVQERRPTYVVTCIIIQPYNQVPSASNTTCDWCMCLCASESGP